MIKLLLILLVGIGLGYTYGYMHGAAGQESLITSALGKVGVHDRHAARGDDDTDADRRARADSLRQRSAIRPSN
jgi:hypothetical protein